MYRRLFFLFPTRQQTRQTVQQLEAMGISPTDIHTFAGDNELLTDLPPATERQQRGLDLQVEKIFWNGNLALFFIAVAGFAVALLSGALGWVALALAGMAATFTLGYVFATHIPKVHLGEFKDALRHHEILLSVDVLPRQVALVGQQVHRQHPEAVDGGVGWSLHKFGL